MPGEALLPKGNDDAKPKKRGTKKYTLRILLPMRPEKPHSTKKEGKGYDRKKEKARHADLMEEELDSPFGNDE